VSDVVLDASALTLAVGGKSAAASALRVQLAGARCHAPHLIDAEVGNVLRRHERDGRLGPGEAAQARRAAAVLVHRRYPHTGPLGDLAWTWRGHLSYYDALYVALAVALKAPLLTADARLSRAPGLPCVVELV
jgi:predicted nucleic acid-binding protein